MSDTSPERVAEVCGDLRMERAFGRVATGPVCSDAVALIEALAAERDAWRELAEARNALMAYHRARSNPPEKVLRRLDLARAALNETDHTTERTNP